MTRPLRAGGFVGAYHPHLGGAPRREADNYPTPAAVTRALVLRAAPPRDGRVREPACGDGAMAKVLEGFGYDVDSSDLRETGFGRGGVDYLRDVTEPDVLSIVTNPPFKLAGEFIAKAIREAPYAAMLLKATYWNAAVRMPLWKLKPPKLVLALTWRPAFLEAERGKAPMMDVLWCVWDSRMEWEGCRYEPLERPL